MSGPVQSTTPATQNGQILIIMATRGRPQMVAEVFHSLNAHTARKDKLEFRIYVDEDDRVTRDAIEKGAFPKTGFSVHWHIGPNTASLGETHQVLWDTSGRTAQICMLSVDDARFD